MKLARQPLFDRAGGGNAATMYTYENQDHPQVTAANGTVTSYVYSARDLRTRGKLTSLTRGATKIDYEYDRFGRTTQDGELGYTFDKNGNATTLTYPGGLVATYTHDYADRPQTLSATPAGGTPQAIGTAASHRPSGPISSLTLGNGLTGTRDFDSRSFPRGILVPGKLDWDYTLDAVGNPTAIADALVPANSTRATRNIPN